MKTEIVITHDDQQYKQYKKGDFGYVDGYIRGGDNVPYAVIVLITTNERHGTFVMAPLHSFKIREYKLASGGGN